MGLCNGMSWELGQEFAMSRVHVQQQLPREFEDEII
jgi:hypothetical protein